MFLTPLFASKQTGPCLSTAVTLLFAAWSMASASAQGEDYGVAAAKTSAGGRSATSSIQYPNQPSLAALRQEPLPADAAPPISNSSARYVASAERLALTAGCKRPVAKIVLDWPPAEMFVIDCRGTDSLLVKCERSACLQMR